MATRHDDRRESRSPDRMPDDLARRLSRFPDVEPPEGLSDRIMDALIPRRRPGWQVMFYRLLGATRFTRTPLRWAPVAAALLVGIAIGFSLKRTPTDPAVPNEHQRAQLEEEAEAQYMLGRQLLAANHPQKAVDHLKRAANTRPDQALYQFWAGVAYWSLDDADQERAHYLAALQNDPGFLPAHVYIGHNYLEQGDYRAAARHYRSVLQMMPDHAEALFNLGVALHHLGEVEKENAAWRAYLDYYDRGPLAQQAVNGLNANGDFSFRRVQLGPLSLVKPVVSFDPEGAKLETVSQDTLDNVGRVLAQNPKLQLHVLAYAASDAEGAKKRSRTIKRYLLDRYPGISAGRIKTSWFGVSERIEIEERTYELDASIHLFATIAEES